MHMYYASSGWGGGGGGREKKKNKIKNLENYKHKTSSFPNITGQRDEDLCVMLTILQSISILQCHMINNFMYRWLIRK